MDKELNDNTSTPALRLVNAIESYAESDKGKSKSIYLLGDVNNVLELHEKRYAEINGNERPLLALNKTIPGCIGGYGWTGLLITDKAIYWRCLKDSFFASLVSIPVKGSIPLKELRNIKFGRQDACFGSSYIGHKLIINDSIIGLLRIVGNATTDETAKNELDTIFGAV